MSDLDDTKLANNLNGEPLVIRGLTSHELMLMIVVSFAIWLPVSLFIGSLFGRTQMGMALMLILVLFSVGIMGTLFQKVKRSRPDGYWQHGFAFFLEDKGIRPTHCIRRSGQWDIGRTVYHDTQAKK